MKSALVMTGLMIQTLALGYPIHYETFITLPDYPPEPLHEPLMVQPIPAPPTHFVSAVQVAILEPNPMLVKRSERVVIEELQQALQRFPGLRGQHFTVQNTGNEVILYVTTAEDVQLPMQELVQASVQRIEPRVHAKGRALFYKTAVGLPQGGYLDVSVTDDHKKIEAISAQAVSLRDLLNVMKDKLANLSYVIPGDCGDRLIDWNFGDTTTEAGGGSPTTVKPVEFVMSEIGTLLDLKVQKKNDTFIFAGNCQKPPAGAPRRFPITDPQRARAFSPSMVVQPRRSSPQATQVVFSLPAMN